MTEEQKYLRNSIPFFVFQRGHLRSTSGIIWGSGSFAVQFGGSFPFKKPFAVLYRKLRWCFWSNEAQTFIDKACFLFFFVSILTVLGGKTTALGKIAANLAYFYKANAYQVQWVLIECQSNYFGSGFGFNTVWDWLSPIGESLVWFWFHDAQSTVLKKMAAVHFTTIPCEPN